MTRNEALGMFVGGAVGDALGAPLEFCSATVGAQHTEMTGGGVHETAPGEWTDDTAMMMCIADAYCSFRQFAPGPIAKNFQRWAKYGEFGTRDYVFDIGNTTRSAIDRIEAAHVYAGSIAYNQNGNGSIMRLAPIIIANCHELDQAVGQSVAVALMTHGTAATVVYTSRLARELCEGLRTPDAKLHSRGDGKGDGSVMGCYASAWDSILATSNFEDALVHAVNKGGDADTVGAVTGMIAGRIYGYDSIPKRWTDVLVKHDEIAEAAMDLYIISCD
jgi:ADP-ribosyl-[dinitrogen reductase] hydrolase